MGNQVFANNMEISCKAADGKSVACFPDVCFTPPQAPPTPMGVPIPYPNTGMAKDTTRGSRTVKITRKEVMLKDKSYFKTSYGDEAGCAPKKGVVTSKIKGKVYFNAWSMDVKFEGENVVRNADLTTHNHGSVPGNTAVWPYIDDTYIGVDTWTRCSKDLKKEYDACKDFKPRKPDGPDPCDSLTKIPAGKKPIQAPAANKLADDVAADKCLSARRCALSPYEPSRCCNTPDSLRIQTPHHIVEASSFIQNRGQKTETPFATFNSPGSYDANKAPCVCAEGTSHSLGGTHELMHTFQSASACKIGADGKLPLASGGEAENIRVTTYGAARDSGVEAFQKVFPDSGCDPDCLKAQLDAYHNQCGIDDNTKCQAVATRKNTPDSMLQEAEEQVQERYLQAIAAR
jgi:hypothetical protein